MIKSSTIRLASPLRVLLVSLILQVDSYCKLIVNILFWILLILFYYFIFPTPASWHIIWRICLPSCLTVYSKHKWIVLILWLIWHVCDKWPCNRFTTATRYTVYAIPQNLYVLQYSTYRTIETKCTVDDYINNYW